MPQNRCEAVGVARKEAWTRRRGAGRVGGDFVDAAHSHGFGTMQSWVEDRDPPGGYTIEAGDCDDDNGRIHPGADEVCDDAVDNDCDGAIDGDDAECG